MNEATAEDEDVPPGWEERITVDGRIFYANHGTERTQWEHPVTGLRKHVKAEMPYGWVRHENETEGVWFEDTVNDKRTRVDPRLAFQEVEKTTMYLQFKQRFDAFSTSDHVLAGVDLKSKYAIITGGNDGIGKDTARALAGHFCHVVMACRDVAKGQRARRQILTKYPHATIEVMHCDLSSFESVDNFAELYRSKGWPIHYLILNAAVFTPPFQQVDGVELTMRVNHLAHFQLFLQLESILVQSSPSRLVILSSESHRMSTLTADNFSLKLLNPTSADTYNALMQYNHSKLCNQLMAISLARRLKDKNVTIFSVHPGNMINTSITRHWWPWKLLFLLVRPFTKSLAQASACTVFCCVAPELRHFAFTGHYFNNCSDCDPSPAALDFTLANMVWNMSKRWVNLMSSSSRNSQSSSNVDCSKCSS